MSSREGPCSCKTRTCADERSTTRNWSVETSGCKLEHGMDLFPRHRELLHPLIDRHSGYGVWARQDDWHRKAARTHARAASVRQRRVTPLRRDTTTATPGMPTTLAL